MKFKTGGIYHTHDGHYVQIVNICQELLEQSVMNKSITIQFLDTREELNVSHCYLDTWGIRYLGDELGVVQVLYGSNFKRG